MGRTYSQKNRWAVDRKNHDWLPIGRRVRGHPKTRWEDEVVAFAAKLMESETVRGEWTAIAQDRLTWSILESDFVNYYKQ